MPIDRGLLHCLSDPIDHSVDVLKDIVIRETDHLITHCLKISLTPIVLLALTDVAIAIDFDDQLCVITAEIYDITINRMLPSESISMYQSAPQPAPQQALWESRFLAKLLGVLD